MRRQCGLPNSGSPELSQWSTASVEPGEAVDYWRDVVCDLYVKIDTAPVAPTFSGEVSCGRYTDFDLSVIRATAEQVRRSKSMIARSVEADEYLLATFQTSGTGVLEQAGRSALLSPGSLVFYETSQPFFIQFDGPWEQVIVQLPVDQAYAMAGLRRSNNLLAIALDAAGATRAAASFFQALATAQISDPDGAASLAPHGMGLIASLLGWATSRESPTEVPDFARRNQVISFLRAHIGDPRLDVDAIARGCLISRRTLFRLFEDTACSVMGQLRVLRIETAMLMLQNQPTRPISAIGQACGFASDTQFYRAFRDTTGTTPAAYRSSAAAADTSDYRSEARCQRDQD